MCSKRVIINFFLGGVPHVGRFNHIIWRCYIAIFDICSKIGVALKNIHEKRFHFIL